MNVTNIINMTQHRATPGQIEDGVIDLTEADYKEVCSLLTLEEVPDDFDLMSISMQLVGIAAKYCDKYCTTHVMVGGQPDLISYFNYELFRRDIQPRSAFSKRTSVEVHNADGSVSKTQIFRHEGWTFPKDWYSRGL